MPHLNGGTSPSPRPLDATSRRKIAIRLRSDLSHVVGDPLPVEHLELVLELRRKERARHR